MKKTSLIGWAIPGLLALPSAKGAGTAIPIDAKEMGGPQH